MNTQFTGINVTHPMFQDAHNYVVGVSAIFLTKDGDKDHDTALNIRVVNADGVLLAMRDGVTGHWVEKSSYLVPLELKNALNKPDVLRGRVDLQILVNGNDAWGFDYELLMFFVGGEVLRYRWKRKQLSHSQNSTSDDWDGECAS